LSTITYLFDGEIMHRDSVGSEQPIRPGEVNWMTAGRGITHSERFERARLEGGPLNGIQAWVALPREHEETDPEFLHYEAAALPRFEQDGTCAHLIAGEVQGLRSPVKTHSPLFYLHCDVKANGRVLVPGAYSERAVYVASGAVEIGGTRITEGNLAVLASGEDVVVHSDQPSIVMALGGEPVGARFIEWNFVSSSQERIEQAKADWRAGRMKLPDLDDKEWIPLPPGPPPPPEPMS
jgi:redox-sensitive bicupin YhaK (pirin superfamily)